jgi:hypothetical protein
MYDGYAIPVQQGPGWWQDEDDFLETVPEDQIERLRANSLIGTARNLESLQREVHEQNLWSAQLYSNRELASFDWGNSSFYRTSLSPVQRTGENLVLMVVDTLVSQIGKHKPKARPQTRGASWHLRTQAKKLDKFLYGEFIRNRVYEKGKQVFRDACIFGFGALYVRVDGDRLAIDRVFPDELLIDQMEVVAGGVPRHIYRRRVLPIDVVYGMYSEGMSKKEKADFEAELELISRQSEYIEYRTVGAGFVVLVEGWQMARKGKPGRYMCAVANKVLDEGEYTLEQPPFVFYHWQQPISGFYSPSAVEQALPYQIRLNEINDVIRDAQDIMGRPRILVAEGSRVNPMEVDNLVGRFIKYTGIRPEAITWPAINAELYNERDRQVRVCLEQFGISALASKVAPPPAARFDSSPALREFNAIQDDRLADPAQRFERFYLDLAELMIRSLRDSGAKPTTVWAVGGGKDHKGQMEVINWADIDLDENAYVLQLEATSVFDSTPSSIRDELEKQLGMGLITPEEYRLQLSAPDDQSELSLAAAAAADIRRVIDLLEQGHYESPTPIQDLVNGVQMVSLAALNLNQYDGPDPRDRVPEETKVNFTNWIIEARNILDIGANPEPEPTPLSESMPGVAAPGMMGPQGMPMAQGPGPAQVPVPEAAGLATQPAPVMPKK